MELIAFLLAVVITFFAGDHSKEVWLDHTTAVITSFVFVFEPTIFGSVVNREFLFCFVSVVLAPALLRTRLSPLAAFPRRTDYIFTLALQGAHYSHRQTLAAYPVG